MKMIKLAASGLAVLFAVGTGLAFKGHAFTPNVLFCFPHGQSVSATASCVSQSNETNIAWDIVSSGGQTANPCPFINLVQEDIYVQNGLATTCTVPVSGTQYAVDPN